MNTEVAMALDTQQRIVADSLSTMQAQIHEQSLHVAALLNRVVVAERAIKSLRRELDDHMEIKDFCPHKDC